MEQIQQHEWVNWNRELWNERYEMGEKCKHCRTQRIPETMEGTLYRIRPIGTWTEVEPQCNPRHKEPAEYRGSTYQPLFDHMHNEHGLILLDSEMQEIIHIVNKIRQK